MSTDCIEKKILLRAPRKKIWRALSDSQEFGHWFGLRFDGPFVPGTSIAGVLTPTTVDPEVGAAQKSHEGLPFEIVIEQVEPERLFSFRWHPFAIEAGVDYSAEPMTLVTFELEEAEGGIMLTLTESGFDQLPLARRAKAFTANDGGWGMMVKVIEKYLSDAQ
jgi:uncharacterized protein YndB with AHSA1/START domain